MKILKIPAMLFLAAMATPSVAAANVPATVAFVTTQMRPGTTLVDVDYRIDDPDDETVEIVVCAFKNGVIGFENFLRVSTLVEGTQASVGQGIRTGEIKRITWDVGVDWGENNGNFSICVMPRDREGFLRIDWISIPGLTASTNSISDEQLMPILYWFLSKGDSELQLNGDSLVWLTGWGGLKLAVGNKPNLLGRTFVYKRLDIGFLLPEDYRRMGASSAGFDLSGRTISTVSISWVSNPWFSSPWDYNPTQRWLVKEGYRGFRSYGPAGYDKIASDGDYFGEFAAVFEVEFFRDEWDYQTQTNKEIIEPCYWWVRMDGRKFYTKRNFEPYEQQPYNGIWNWFGPRTLGAHAFENGSSSWSP